MPSRLKTVLAACLILYSSSCSWSRWGKQIEDLNARVDQVEANNKGLRDTIFERMIQLEVQHDLDNRKVWSRFNCKEQKVYDFLKQCEGGGSQVCSDVALAAALNFMDTQTFAVIYLRPDKGIKGLHPVRRGQLLQLADSRSQTASTRYLILVQPRGETPSDQDEALSAGRDLLKYLRTDINLPKLIPIIGPSVLPCKLKQEQLKHYGRRVDTPQVGEPQSDEPRLRFWVFRTDC